MRGGAAGLLPSNFRQHFARGQDFAYDLEDLGHYYADYVRLMAHVNSVLPGRVHRVIYEYMVDDTEAEVRALLDYCGLDFEPACLEFYKTERAVRTASSEQVRQPIYRDATEEWRPVRAAPSVPCGSRLARSSTPIRQRLRPSRNGSETIVHA